MDRTQKQRLIATNATVLIAGTLASFVLPLITDSIVDGKGEFLRMLAHAFPLFCAIGFSCSLMSRAMPESSSQLDSRP